MWNAIKTKLFRAVGKKVPHSEFVALAKERGLLTDEQVEAAEQLLADNPDQTSGDILVRHELLTEQDAQIISLEQKKAAPAEHITDQFKRANTAVEDTGAIHLSEIAAAVAKKQ